MIAMALVFAVVEGQVLNKAQPSSQIEVTNTVWMKIEFIDARMNPTNQIIVIDLFGKDMPKTVNNFIKLCDPTYQQKRKR